MKRLVPLLLWIHSLPVFGQSFPVRNINEDYFVSVTNENDGPKTSLQKVKIDAQGLYWFQGVTDLYSYDGVHWKSYRLVSAGKRNSPFRLNNIEITDDGMIWLATEDGIYLFDPKKEHFVPVRQKFPGINGFPLAVSYISQVAPGKIIFTTEHMDGIFLLDWKTPKLKHIAIDSASRTYVLQEALTSDKQDNVWGLTTDGKGVWNYQLKKERMLCSWKGELPLFSGKRFQNLADLDFSDNKFWISHGTNGYLEMIDIPGNKSIYYSFSGDLHVQMDSNAREKQIVGRVKIDRDNNAWARIGKYVVKLKNDPAQVEYIMNDPINFPTGDFKWIEPAMSASENTNDVSILLWIGGKEKICVVKKKQAVVRHIPLKILPGIGITPNDCLNDDERKSIFLFKGKEKRYYLLMQNAGKPKLVCLDQNFNATRALLNDQWRDYPAYFSHEFDPDTLFIAIMRPEMEPLDFRNVILKDFKIDLHTLTAKEVTLDFKQRVWHYGVADASQVYWLFSNGTLYSYDPQKDFLDSIFICKPAEKKSYRLEFIKGFNYPTVLHKATSTFWIDFVSTKELYKINLKKRKIEKIFNCCMDKEDCDVPGGIYDFYNLGADKIYFQLSFSTMLLDPAADTFIDYSELFNKQLVAQNPTGSVMYKDWICMVFPSHIYFLNTTSGEKKKLVLNEDFRWATTQFNSPPLVNDRGELVLMSAANKGFLVVNIDSVPKAPMPGKIHLSFVRLDNRNLPVDSLLTRKQLTLKFNKYNSIMIGFSDHTIYDPDKIAYEYTLYNGGDTAWNRIPGKPELNFSEISPGRYHLLLRSVTDFGDHSGEVTSFPIRIIPPFWQTWWFRALVIAALALLFYGFYRYRLQQLNKLQAIRNNIASDLHDDIGSTLNSISVYSEVAKQQAGKEIPALDVIGMNSRKIVESMSDIVWTINPENDSFEKIIIRMRSFAYQLLKAKKIEYTFESDEKLNRILLPMQVRKNFYLVFKEAVTNITKYAEASMVTISLDGKNSMIILEIQDNGKGIPTDARAQGNGLLNMSRRAQEIKAELNILSSDKGGTRIELKLKT